MIKYLTISSELLRLEKMSYSKKILYALLSLLTKKGEQSTTSSDGFIANEIGMTANYVNRCLKDFQRDGIIEISKEFGRRMITLTEPGKKFIYNHEKKGKDAKN